jgi:hypothetical protein
VKAAGGTRGDPPELRWDEAGRTARAALDDVRDGATQAAGDIRHGRLAPSLRRKAAHADPAAAGRYEQWDGAGAEPAFATPFEQHPPIH